MTGCFFNMESSAACIIKLFILVAYSSAHQACFCNIKILTLPSRARQVSQLPWWPLMMPHTKIGWKCLAATNARAYHTAGQITVIKLFYTTGPQTW